MTDPKTRRPWKMISKRMWEVDGKPEYEGPTSAPRRLYEDWTKNIFDALHAAGYRIVKTRIKKP